MRYFSGIGAAVKRRWLQRAETYGIFSGRRADPEYRISAGGDGSHDGGGSGGGEDAVFGNADNSGLLLLFYLYILL